MTCRTGRSTSPAGVCGQGGVVVGRGVTWMPAEGEHDLTPAAPEPGRRCRPKVSRWRKGITASRASAGQAPECPETPRSPQGLAARDGLVERDMFAARASSPQRAPIPQHMRTDIGLICEAALGVDLDMLGRPTGKVHRRSLAGPPAGDTQPGARSQWRIQQFTQQQLRGMSGLAALLESNYPRHPSGQMRCVGGQLSPESGMRSPLVY